MSQKVVAVNRSASHLFSKSCVETINLITDFGVEGDVHAGEKVKHLFLAKKDPNRKNIRQIHLIALELLSELNDKGFAVEPGQLGENITTQGIDLLGLPVGSQLRLGENAIVTLTALRNPCIQIDKFQKGMLKEVVGKDEHGNIVRKVGVMGVVTDGGRVQPDDKIIVVLPKSPHSPLEYIW